MQSRWNPETYTRAYRFAARSHAGQLLAGTDLPYVTHVTLACMEVIAAFRSEKERDEDLAIQCALLHDVLEDTQVTFRELREEFGETVAQGVLALTKDPGVPKEQQLRDSLRRIRQQPVEVWMVKLADRISNLRPPPSFWSEEKIRTYHRDALLIHETLREASPALASRLQFRISEYHSYFR
jgi:(p)ppGpp synthase/HD superfamily hydrolase